MFLAANASAEVITFKSPPQPSMKGANDISLTLDKAMAKGVALQPEVFDNPGSLSTNKKTVTFKVPAGVDARVKPGQRVTGTITLAKGEKGPVDIKYAWSYPAKKKAEIPAPAADIAVAVNKVMVGGQLEGLVTITNRDSAPAAFSDFLLGYNIPQAYFGDSNSELAAIDTNNLYLSSTFGTTMVSDSLSTLAGGATATFEFGLGKVDALDYIALDFNVTDTSGDTYNFGIGDNAQPVPEPASLSLLAVGTALASLFRCRARKRSGTVSVNASDAEV